MENKVVVEVTRDKCEEIAVKEFTDKEWEVLSGEIEGMLNHYLESELVDIIENLDELMDEVTD